MDELSIKLKDRFHLQVPLCIGNARGLATAYQRLSIVEMVGIVGPIFVVLVDDNRLRIPRKLDAWHIREVLGPAI